MEATFQLLLDTVFSETVPSYFAWIRDFVVGGLVTGTAFVIGYVALISVLSIVEDRSNDSGQPVLDIFLYTPPAACGGAVAASLGLLRLSLSTFWKVVGGWATVGAGTSLLVWRSLARPKPRQD